VAQSTDALLTDEENTVRVVQEYGPSVVAMQITVEGVQVHPLLQPREQAGGGSGFIVDEAGRIITNFHVVQPTLSEEALANGVIELRPEASITVSFLGDPDREHPVRVRGANPDFDLALLEFEDPGAAPALALMTELKSLPIDSGPLPPQLFRAGRAQVAAPGSFSVPFQQGTPTRAHGRMAPLWPGSRNGKEPSLPSREWESPVHPTGVHLVLPQLRLPPRSEVG